ncbi:Uncharacterised protein [Bordetella pertussis]|nr:Uncharacterised protein [Bordetella pertussis]
MTRRAHLGVAGFCTAKYSHSAFSSAWRPAPAAWPRSLRQKRRSE